MPNWCEGWVKFRGSKENLINFITNEFNGAEPEICFSDLEPNIPKRLVFLNSLDRSCVYSSDIEEANDPIMFNDKGIGIFTAKIRHAWAVSGQGYEELAQKYSLDIKGKCYEKGMEFMEEFEINNKGEVLHYEESGPCDYFWECECPTLGG